MLIDDLLDREDRIQLFTLDNPHFFMDGLTPHLLQGDYEWSLSDEAYQELLNILKIPIKYAGRLFEHINGALLGNQNINFWLKRQPNITLLLEDQRATQVLKGSKPYVSALRVNDVIAASLKRPKLLDGSLKGGLLQAVYLDEDQKLGLRVIYSDCYRTTTRIDGILAHEDHYLVVPVEGKKIRSAGTTEYHIVNQLEAFCVDALAEIKSVNPLGFLESHDVEPVDFIFRLAAELRLTKLQRDSLLEVSDGKQENVYELIGKLNKAKLDLEALREVQIATTRYWLEGSFK